MSAYTFNPAEDTDDEPAWHNNCPICGLGEMDAKRSSIICDCDWFNNTFPNEESDDNE